MVFCNGKTMYINNQLLKEGHNPYFNRWFSAIYEYDYCIDNNINVTILILIDGFLQYNKQ